MPTFSECLGSIKTDFSTLCLAHAQGEGTNRLKHAVRAALFAHPSQSWYDQHLSWPYTGVGEYGWVHREAQEETLSTQSTQLCRQNTLTFSPGHSMTQVQVPGKVPDQVPSDRTQTPAAQWDPWWTHSKMDGETWIHVSTTVASPWEQIGSNSGVLENCLLSALCLTFPPV